MTQRISDEEVTALANSVSDPIIVGRLARDLYDLRRAVGEALHELGVPSDGYPVPVANAVIILRLSTGKPE